MSLIAATRTARGYRDSPSRGPAQTRSSAGQSEHANSLGVGRNSPARIRAIAAESSLSSFGTSSAVNVVDTTSSGRSRNWYATSTSLRTCAEADERVHEPLQRVLGLDDLGRRSALERVRLVVDDERPRTVPPEDVEPAANDDAVVLEGERTLGPGAAQARDALREFRAQYASTSAAIRSSSSAATSGYHSRTARSSSARGGAAGSSSGTSSSRRWTASPISVAASPPPARHARHARGTGGRARARRSSGTSSARRARARCTRGGARRAPSARGSRRAAAARSRASGARSAARRTARAEARRPARHRVRPGPPVRAQERTCSR